MQPVLRIPLYQLKSSPFFQDEGGRDPTCKHVHVYRISKERRELRSTSWQFRTVEFPLPHPMPLNSESHCIIHTRYQLGLPVFSQDGTHVCIRSSSGTTPIARGQSLPRPKPESRRTFSCRNATTDFHTCQHNHRGGLLITCLLLFELGSCSIGFWFQESRHSPELG